MEKTEQLNYKDWQEAIKAGGGWKPGPGMTDKGKIFVVGSGLEFEKTKRANQRGGQGTCLAQNVKWSLKHQEEPQQMFGTSDAEALESAARYMFEWRL